MLARPAFTTSWLDYCNAVLYQTSQMRCSSNYDECHCYQWRHITPALWHAAGTAADIVLSWTQPSHELSLTGGQWAWMRYKPVTATWWVQISFKYGKETEEKGWKDVLLLSEDVLDKSWYTISRLSLLLATTNRHHLHTHTKDSHCLPTGTINSSHAFHHGCKD